MDGSRWSSLASSFLRPTSSLPQRSSSTSSIWLNQGICTTLDCVAFTVYESMIGDAMRIQNTVFDVDFLASKVVSQPLHSVTATSLRAKPLSLRALRRGHEDDAQVALWSEDGNDLLGDPRHQGAHRHCCLSQGMTIIDNKIVIERIWDFRVVNEILFPDTGAPLHDELVKENMKQAW